MLFNIKKSEKNTRHREIIGLFIWLFEGMTEINLGFAHSVETWYEGRLVGGLYGVSLGKCFFGESMFSTMDNASKTALITLCQKLEEKGFLLIDCQVYSKHLESLGAVNIDRDLFLKYLEAGLSHETLRGNWKFFNEQKQVRNN